jgi:beta-lactamase superfamily II metal-dependent hydrolase
MLVKFLKAGTGDSIVINHKEYNIVIDGGSDSKQLLQEVDRIFDRKQIIDLLVITHHDDDHIRGIIELLQHVKEGMYNSERNFISKVIFNSPRLILKKVSEEESKFLSYRQAYEVELLLNEINTSWIKYTEDSEPIRFEDLIIEVLSPNKEDLKVYALQSGAYLSSDDKCDWNSPMIKLEKNIDDICRDNSVSNKSSVVLKVNWKDKSILLTGDVTPDRLEVIMDKLYEKNGQKPVRFELVKLPHHGSVTLP